jgi:hypothetical protein
MEVQLYLRSFYKIISIINYFLILFFINTLSLYIYTLYSCNIIEKNTPFDPSFQFGLKNVLPEIYPTLFTKELTQIEKICQSYCLEIESVFTSQNTVKEEMVNNNKKVTQ